MNGQTFRRRFAYWARSTSEQVSDGGIAATLRSQVWKFNITGAVEHRSALAHFSAPCASSTGVLPHRQGLEILRRSGNPPVCPPVAYATRHALVHSVVPRQLRYAMNFRVVVAHRRYVTNGQQLPPSGHFRPLFPLVLNGIQFRNAWL